MRSLFTGVLVLGPVLLVPAVAEDAKALLRGVSDGTSHFMATVKEEGLASGFASLWLPYGDGQGPTPVEAKTVALNTPPESPTVPATYTTQGGPESPSIEPTTAEQSNEAAPLSLIPPVPVLALPPERTEPAKESAAVIPPAPVPASAPEKPEPKTEPPPPQDISALAKEKPAPAAAAPAAPIPAPVTAPAPEKKETEAAPPATAGKKDAKPPLPAKQLFAAAKSPAPLAARSIGFYAKGCLAGGKPLSIDGPAWQVMRLSRNRFYGHPTLIALLERLANEVKQNKEWPGLLVGDISQPRGGPMLTGHASHQVGLDADIWLTPMPDRRLNEKERENLSATSMLASDDISVNPKVWNDGQVKLIKRAASYKDVERILVHPAIKKALCDATAGQTDRAWLHKVRPYFGHYYHFHVRIGCPSGSGHCTAQPPVPGDDGCGDELKDWIKRVTPKPPTQEAKPTVPARPAPKKPEITLADLPSECRAVLASGGNVPPTEAVMVDTSKDAGPDPANAVDSDPPQVSAATAKAQ